MKKAVTKNYRYFFFACLTLVVLSGCRSAEGSYYSDLLPCSVQEVSPDFNTQKNYADKRNPVIFIHGLMGAVLSSKNASGSEQNVLWGDFAFWPMLNGCSFDALALPMPQYRRVAANAVQVDGLLLNSRLSCWPISWQLENYQQIINWFVSKGYVPEASVGQADCSCNFYVFYYDWRLGIDENAARLADFIDEKTQAAAAARQRCRHAECKKNPAERFDLVGHSMGGLIARYYVQYGRQSAGKYAEPLPECNWSGADKVRKVIMIAAPNGGYADTFLELVNGLQLSWVVPRVPAAVLGTFVSYYQMLPDEALQCVEESETGRIIDIFDIAQWKRYQWGLLQENADTRRVTAKMFPDLTEQERYDALCEQLRCLLSRGSRFKLLMAKPMGLPPDPVRFYILAGASFPTSDKLCVDSRTGVVRVKTYAAGDGKVTLHSARFELSGEHNIKASPIVWQGMFALDGAHMGVMRSRLFDLNLSSILDGEQ